MDLIIEKNSLYQFVDWGLVPYNEALRRQEDLVERIAAEDNAGIIVFCSHPPVVTRGRATQPDDITTWRGPQIEIARGGRATYHGPSQLVVYPILNLNLNTATRPGKDIGAYLRGLEKAIVDSLATLGISAHGKSGKDETGVWVGEKKIASIGIGVRKWISFHGAAINLEHDPEAFRGLRPCGFSPEIMISLEELLGHRPDRNQFKILLRQELQKNI